MLFKKLPDIAEDHRHFFATEVSMLFTWNSEKVISRSQFFQSLVKQDTLFVWSGSIQISVNGHDGWRFLCEISYRRGYTQNAVSVGFIWYYSIKIRCVPV